MRSISTRAGATALLFIAAIIFAAGFSYNWFEDRNRLRLHVSATAES